MALHGIDFYMLATGTQEGNAFIHYFHPASGSDVQEEDGCVSCKKFHQELRGHTGAIWTLAFSKDGCLLATGSADKTVRVWDVHQASYDAMARANPGKEILLNNKILAAAGLPNSATDIGIRHGDKGEVKKLSVRLEPVEGGRAGEVREVREAEVMWERLNQRHWIDLLNIKNDLETAYQENNPIILQVAMFEAHQSFVRQLRWRKGAKHKSTEPKDAREERTLVTCSPDGTIRIWTAPKQLRKAREWDKKHHPPLAELNDDGKVPTPSSPSAAKSPSAPALTDLARPPAGAGLGELPALPPLPRLEDAPSSSALRLAGSGNEAAASANTTLAR